MALQVADHRRPPPRPARCHGTAAGRVLDVGCGEQPYRAVADRRRATTSGWTWSRGRASTPSSARGTRGRCPTPRSTPSCARRCSSTTATRGTRSRRSTACLHPAGPRSSASRSPTTSTWPRTTTAAGRRRGSRRTSAPASRWSRSASRGLAGSLLGALWLNWIEHIIGRSRWLQLVARARVPALDPLQRRGQRASRARSTRSTPRGRSI